jgi:hypothetical protein
MMQVQKPYPPPGWCALDGVLFCDNHKISVHANGKPLMWRRKPDGRIEPYVEEDNT